MTKAIALLGAVLVLLTACGPAPRPAERSPELEAASAHYRKHRDYDSLRRICDRLATRTPRAEVERLLGEPDYSPIEGQYYYSSDRQDYLEGAEGRKATVGAVVDYRDAQGALTDRLQSIRLGPIGE